MPTTGKEMTVLLNNDPVSVLLISGPFDSTELGNAFAVEQRFTSNDGYRGIEIDKRWFLVRIAKIGPNSPLETKQGLIGRIKRCAPNVVGAEVELRWPEGEGLFYQETANTDALYLFGKLTDGGFECSRPKGEGITYLRHTRYHLTGRIVFVLGGETPQIYVKEEGEERIYIIRGPEFLRGLGIPVS